MTTNPDCRVCLGRGTVALAVHSPVGVVTSELSVPVMTEVQVRHYSCPECGDYVSMDRVSVLEYVTGLEVLQGGEELMRVAEQGARASLGRVVAEFPGVQVERSTRRGYPETAIRARVGVVSQGALSTIEQRVRRRQEAVANEVVEEALLRVTKWDSDRGAESVAKSVVHYLIGEALRDVLRRYS